MVESTSWAKIHNCWWEVRPTFKTTSYEARWSHPMISVCVALQFQLVIFECFSSPHEAPASFRVILFLCVPFYSPVSRNTSVHVANNFYKLLFTLVVSKRTLFLLIHIPVTKCHAVKQKTATWIRCKTF